MMLGAAVLVVGLATSSVADLPLLLDALVFATEAQELLLQGRPLPRDYRARLMRMPPDARLQSLIYLRRAGLLRSDSWSLDDLLKPAQESGE